MKFVMFLFYNYYSKGPTRSIAYIKTVGTMTFLVFIMVLDFLILTNNENLFLFKEGDSSWIKYLKVGLYTFPILLFFLIFFKEKKIANQNYSESKIKSGNKLLVFFTVVIVLSLVVIPLIKYRM